MNAEPNVVSAHVSVPRTTASIGDLQVTVELRNEGSTPVRLNAIAMQSPTTSLRIRGPEGASIQPGPPPVPPIDDGAIGRLEIGAGKSATLRYSGRSYAAGRSFPPGRYQVMFRYTNTAAGRGDWVGTIESAWAGFEIAPR